MEFSSILRKLLKENNISKSKLIADLNLGKGTIATWEARGTIPSGDVLSKIADYFDVSVDYLLGRAKEKAPQTESYTDLMCDADLQELINIYNSLSERGKGQLIGYADALKKEIPTETAKVENDNKSIFAFN